MSAGIVLGAMVAVLGLYLSQSRADEWAPVNVGPDKTVTISERELKKLVDRISALESSVQSLEEKSGTILLNGWSATAVLPEGRANDGFGPVKTILIHSSNSAK
jgi:hypothetical protein